MPDMAVLPINFAHGANASPLPFHNLDFLCRQPPCGNSYTSASMPDTAGHAISAASVRVWRHSVSPVASTSACWLGHFSLPYVQKTQQSPGSGRRTAPHAVQR